MVAAVVTILPHTPPPSLSDYYTDRPPPPPWPTGFATSVRSFVLLLCDACIGNGEGDSAGEMDFNRRRDLVNK